LLWCKRDVEKLLTLLTGFAIGTGNKPRVEKAGRLVRRIHRHGGLLRGANRRRRTIFNSLIAPGLEILASSAMPSFFSSARDDRARPASHNLRRSAAGRVSAGRHDTPVTAHRQHAMRQFGRVFRQREQIRCGGEVTGVRQRANRGITDHRILVLRAGTPARSTLSIHRIGRRRATAHTRTGTPAPFIAASTAVAFLGRTGFKCGD